MMNNSLRSIALYMGLCLTAGCTMAPSARVPMEYFPEKDPGAAYSSAVRVGDVIHLAGQIGIRQDGSFPDGIQEQTRLALANMSAQLQTMGSSLDNVFKCTVMLSDIADWAEFNKVYASHFKPGRLPARNSFAVAGLALKEMKIELVCLAYSPQ